MKLHRLLLVSLVFFAGLGCETQESDPDGDEITLQPDRARTPKKERPSDHALERLATGAMISGANGMHFGPDGLLYVASVIGSEIVVLDPESGEVVRRFTEGVDGPDDIAFHSDGRFYWTSILTGEVAGMRPDGSILPAAMLTPGSNPITFSPDDRLFVSQCFFDDKLYEVDPEGVDAPRLISDELGPGCGLNGMDWGPDGRLYGPRWFRGEVVSFDVDSKEMRKEAEGFQVPAAVKFDSKGRLHVLDTGAGSVIRVEGSEHTVIARLVPGLDNFAFDAKDRLFVSSFVDGFVTRVDEDGSSTELVPGGLSHPGGIAFRKTARGPELVVADLQSLRGFDATTGEPTFVERNVLGVGAMGSVSNVSVDGSNLVLTSWLDATVKVWNPASRTVVEVHEGLEVPVSALRYAGRVIVAEHGRERVIALGETDQDEIDILAEKLPAPTGLFKRKGDLYVGDRVRREILRIAIDGIPVKPPEVVAKNVPSPEGFAVLDEGIVVIDGASGAVVWIDRDGSRKTLGRTGRGSDAASEMQPPSMIFNGVAVDSDGMAYVTGETSRTIDRVRLP